MDLEKCRYIVVEGPIGAGKTSLARALAQRARRRGAASSGPRTTRSSRASTSDMRALRAADAAHVPVPARRPARAASASSTCSAARPSRDFLLDKDPLFARLNLSDAEYRLYEKVYSHLKPQTPTPDLVDLPAGAGRHAGRARAPARRRLRAHDLGALPRAPRRRVQPLLLSVRGGAAADRQQRAAQLRRQRASMSTLLLARIAAMRGRREFFNLGSR